MQKLPLDRSSWPFLAFTASALMLATAHAFERFLLLAPCPLCYNQRQIYWVAGAIGLIGILLNWRRAPARVMCGVCVLLGFVFLASAGVASYHSLVEWGILPAPDTCAVGKITATGGDLWEKLGKPMAVPSCADAKWRMLGLSMAGWNVLVSIGLAGLSFFAASRRMRTDTANEPVQLDGANSADPVAQ
jgi:disulfide bond formation protein DsbB